MRLTNLIKLIGDLQMKKHKDLLEILKANKMRITVPRRLLLQFIIDNSSRQITLRDIYEFMDSKLRIADRSSIYRNIEVFKKLDIIQELNLPTGKVFQYIIDRKIRHFYICKACGKSNRGNEVLFQKIENALLDVHGFSKAKLSLVFYGYCSKCTKN